MTFNFHLKIILLFLCSLALVPGFGQHPTYFTNVLECAKEAKPDCSKLLEEAVAKSQKENNFEAHSKFLAKSANRLKREGYFDLVLQTISYAKKSAKNKPVKEEYLLRFG